MSSNEGEKYWKDKASSIVVKNRPKLQLFELIPGMADNPSMKCHIVPRSAAGCFTNSKNVIYVQHLCPTCQCLDKLFTLWQGDNDVATEVFERKWCMAEETLQKLASGKFKEYMAARRERTEVILSMTAVLIKK
jgi:hypothetical protein